MKQLLVFGACLALVSTSGVGQTLPDQSVPSAPGATTGQSMSTASVGGTPNRAGPKLKKKKGFFGLPLLALAAAGTGGGIAAAASGGGGNNSSPASN